MRPVYFLLSTSWQRYHSDYGQLLTLLKPEFRHLALHTTFHYALLELYITLFRLCSFRRIITEPQIPHGDRFCERFVGSYAQNCKDYAVQESKRFLQP